MTDYDFQTEMLKGLGRIEEVQRKQTELLERLITVEADQRGVRDDVSEIRRAHDELFSRLRSLEEELSQWRTVRKIIAWLGPTGAIAAAIAFYQSTGGAGGV